jgi:hypothetical protein
MDLQDYQKLLAELEREQENTGRMIAWVKSKMAQGGVSADAQSNSSVTGSMNVSAHPGIPSDAFFRMSVPLAIKSFLGRLKRPTTAKEITAGLDAGGLTHQAKNLYATVYPTLLRMEVGGEVVRVTKGKWGLSEWYPNRKSASPEKAEGTE